MSIKYEHFIGNFKHYNNLHPGLGLYRIHKEFQPYLDIIYRDYVNIMFVTL